MLRLAAPARALAPSLAMIAMLSSVSAEGETGSKKLEVGAHRTTAGHDFHYMRIRDAKTVAITVSWPSDWIHEGGAVAVPLVGSRLMVDGGAGTRDAATLLADFQDLNARGEIDPNLDDVRGTLIAPPQSLTAAAAIARDVLIEPLLDDRWRKRILRDFKTGEAEEQDQVVDQSWDTISRYILGNGKLNDFLTRQPVTLFDAATLAEIETWHAATFKAGNVKIAAAGPSEPAAVAEAIDQLLDGMPARAPAPANDNRTMPKERTAQFDGKTILLHKPDAGKSMIAMMGPMPPTREPGYLADLLATRVLGEINQSRLFDAIRTRLRASYSFGSGTYIYNRDTRLIYLFGEVDDRRLKDAHAAFREVYETLRTEGMTADELQAAKEVLATSFEDTQHRPQGIAGLIIDFLLDDNELAHRADELPDIVRAIDVEQANTALRERLPKFEDMVRIVTAPQGDAIDADCVISSVADVDRCRG